MKNPFLIFVMILALFASNLVNATGDGTPADGSQLVVLAKTAFDFSLNPGHRYKALITQVLKGPQYLKNQNILFFPKFGEIQNVPMTIDMRGNLRVFHFVDCQLEFVKSEMAAKYSLEGFNKITAQHYYQGFIDSQGTVWRFQNASCKK